jgi:hypothetical protein
MPKAKPTDPPDEGPVGGATPNPLGDAFKLLQDVGGKLTDAAAKLADDVIESPAGSFVEPLARLGAQAAELSTAWVTPVKAILDEQQELVDALAAWSEQQRVLAERFAALAERHRQLSTQTMSVLGPLLDQVEHLGQVGHRGQRRRSGG